MLEEALQQFQVYACFQSSGIRTLEVNSDQPRGWMKMGRVARQESETGAHQMGDSCRPTMSTLTTVLCNGYGSPDSKTPLVGRSLSQSKFVLRPRPLSPLGRTNARGRARLPPRSGLPPHHHLVFSSRLMHDETPIRTTSLLSLSMSSHICCAGDDLHPRQPVHFSSRLSVTLAIPPTSVTAYSNSLPLQHDRSTS
jgi:hypothetical protein